jgi:hypothetical protein
MTTSGQVTKDRGRRLEILVFGADVADVFAGAAMVIRWAHW